MDNLRVELLKDLIAIYATEYAYYFHIAAQEPDSSAAKEFGAKANATKETIYKFIEENFS